MSTTVATPRGTVWLGGRPLPDGGVGYSGYDHAESLAAAGHAYARRRKVQHFILTPGSPDLARPCGACGLPLADVDDGANRCEYVPARQAFRLMHYGCSWGVLLGALGSSVSLAEASRKLTAAERTLEVPA